MSEFQVVDPTLNEENNDAIRNEIKRLLNRFITQKKHISKEANKDINKLRHDDQEEHFENVERAIRKLEAPFTLFVAIYDRLTHLYTLLEGLHNPEEKDAEENKRKLSEEIAELEKEQNKYEEEIYVPAHRALRKTRRDLKTQNGPSSTTTSHAPHKHNWKPTECYKPGILNLPAEVNLQQFEEWVGRLKAHLDGHEDQNVKNINIIVGDLLHKDVKSAINFDPKATTPIFSEKENGTKQENSLEERLKDYWERKNPLSKLRSEAFGLQSTKYETFDQWKSRAKQTFSKADLNNITGPAIEGLIVLMNFHGPYCDEIRKKVVEKFKEGNITIPDIEAIAQEIELVETMNDKQDPSQLNKLHYKGEKNNKNKKELHPHLKILLKEGKCFSCANKHGKDNKCKRESFTCIFCKKPNHTKPACTAYYDHLKAGGTSSKSTKNKAIKTEDSDEQQAEEPST